MEICSVALLLSVAKNSVETISWKAQSRLRGLALFGGRFYKPQHDSLLNLLLVAGQVLARCALRSGSECHRNSGLQPQVWITCDALSP